MVNFLGCSSECTADISPCGPGDGTINDRRVFTPQTLALIRQMADRGCSAPEIARAIGSTPSSVRVKCSHHGIRLKRGPGGVTRPSSGHKPQEYVHQVPVVAYMPAALYAKFNNKAGELRRPASAFASMLLTAIATNNLYRAILDD